MSTLQLVDGFLLKHRTDQEILPTTTETEMEAATGGLVLTPSSGMRDYVGVFDLTSLYPSTMLTLNLSRETIVEEEAEADIIVPDVPLNDDQVPGDRITARDISWDFEDGVGISFDQQGFLPKYGSLLFDDRDAMKRERSKYDSDSPNWVVWDNKQNSIKVLMNSMFGVSDNKYFRLSTEGLGDAITGGSRYVTWKASEILRDITNSTMVYGDTDSLLIQYPVEGHPEDVEIRDVVEWMLETNDRLNARMSEVADGYGLPEDHPYMRGMDLHGTERHCWEFQCETVYRRFIQTGKKKRYAGNIAWSAD